MRSLFVMLLLLACSGLVIAQQPVNRSTQEQLRDQFKERASRGEGATEGAQQAAPKEDKLLEDLLIGLFVISPALLIIFVFVCLHIVKARSPLLVCSNCHWRGKKLECAKTGQVTDPTHRAIANRVMDGGWVVLELFQWVKGDYVCPRCGRDSFEVASKLPPPPPRKHVRELPGHRQRQRDDGRAP
ncbi:MAG: hypothetical protein H6841_06545 [Planctomycetes bacterium]|nr:hypothetical protein [Planctomycetota bacterium]MCB9936206.1 hypothetical protein [Planctomycetota bacterium]